MVVGCDHNFKKHPEFDCLICKCGAIAEDTTAKDPFHQGEVPVLKPGRDEWEALSKLERHEWFEVNRARILVDVERYGYSKAREKWDIVPATWSLTMRRWGVALVRQTWEPRRPENVGPQLPEFSNDWTPEVQLKWLEIYDKRIAR